MKDNKIIIANDGPDKNVMVMTPPLCFTCDNARRVVQVFDQALREIENDAASVGLTTESGDNRVLGAQNIPFKVFASSDHEHSSDDDVDDPSSKRAKYEEMD